MSKDAQRSVLRYAWAAPASVVGLVLALLARVLGARLAVVDGVLEASGGRLGEWAARLPAPFRFNAITFGHVILGVSEAAIAACRAHEQVHVLQYERWGILFFPLYLGSSLVQLLCGRYAYRDNHFEREAYRPSAMADTPEGRRWRGAAPLYSNQEKK
jgi:hypothetical protein